MESTTALNKLKEQAESNAFKRLQAQFSSPEQLEQIDQHINRNEKRKGTVELQLKTAIQSHFICVNTCMEQLKDVNSNLSDVKTTIFSIQEDYHKISHLETTLSELRKEANKHKQLKAAKENVKNILNVDDLAGEAEIFIQNNKLLNAHKCLIDMEKCRNDILEELGPPNDRANNIADIKLVEEFFKKVKDIQRLLHNHVFVTIKRMLDVPKSYPEQLVTAIRIIEREEILDEDWKKKKEETGFSPNDRPKSWRKECLDTIKQLFETQLYGCRIEERDTDDSWFSKHLGNICSRLLYDLEIVKKLCEPCFPSSYKIFEYSVNCVHEIVGGYLKSLLDENSLKDQEFFILLSWLDTYKSDYFMGNAKLNLDVTKLPELLDTRYYNKALSAHIECAARKMAMWFNNAMDKNFNEWYSTNYQPMVIHNYFESNMPNDINTMLIQQLDLNSYANDDRFSKEILKLVITQLNNFVDYLRNKLSEYRMSHFKNTQILKNNFIIRMITTSNDCVRLKESFLLIRNRYDKFMDKDEISGPNDQYELLGQKIMQISDSSLDCIVEDMTKCLEEKHFKFLLSREWLSNDKIINDILVTSNDYMNDVDNLREESKTLFLVKWHNRIKAEYMKGLFQNHSIMSRVLRKFQLTEPSERKLFTTKLKKEIDTLEVWFQQMDDKSNFDFKVLSLMNNVIKTDDVDFIAVELGALTKHCPLSSEMLYALLCMRGDISKTDFKENYENYCTEDTNRTRDEAMLIIKKELKIS